MKNKLTIILSIVISVVLSVTLNFGLPAVKGMKLFAPATTTLGTAFSYQGRLEKDGAPVNGVTCSFKFGLYDSDSGGSPLGSGIQTIGLPLTNGLFSTTLDFGAAFNGDARWLEVATQCPGDTGYTTIGRFTVNATPYALYAKAIPLAGSGSEATAARSDHDHFGQNWTGSTETGLALSGATYGLDATGTFTGVVGWGSNYGVLADGDWADLALGGTEGKIVVSGAEDADMSLAPNDNITLHLDDDNNSSSKFSIQAGDNSEAFSVDETGKVQWLAQTNYLPVPSGSFVPASSQYQYIFNLNGNITTSDLSYAGVSPVVLPQGAVIRQITFHWDDTSITNNAQMMLIRTAYSTQAYSTLATLQSSDSTGYGNTVNIEVDGIEIDNINNMYQFFIYLYPNVKFLGAVIQYETIGPD